MIKTGDLCFALIVILAPARHRYEYCSAAPGLEPDTARGFIAAHARHSDVEQYCLWPRARAPTSSASAPEYAVTNCVAKHLEHRGERGGSVAVVVGDLTLCHALGRLGRPQAGSLRLPPRFELGDDNPRQTHQELAAATEALAGCRYLAAVQRDESLHQRKADTQAAFGPIDRRIRLAKTW
jgi:hypothetical protein